MKTLTIIGAAVLLFFTACKKNGSSGSTYSVSFTFNGVNKTFTGYVGAKFGTLTGYITLTVLGSDSSTSVNNNFGFYLDNYTGGSPIVAGQYQDTDTTYTLLTNYTSNGVTYDAGQTVAAAAVTNNVPITNHFKVNITSLTNTTIRGNFSGDYYQAGNVQAGAKVTITNGSFYVLIH